MAQKQPAAAAASEWGISEDLLNAGASIFDPEVGEFMEKVAAGLPEDSVLLKPVIGRALGVANSFVESLSKRSKSKLLKVLAEKSTDYIDFFREAARKRKGGEALPTEKTKKSAQTWMDEFFKDAGERLKKSPTPRLTALDIQDEFRLRVALLKTIEQARKELEPEPEKKQPVEQIDWDALYAKLKEVLGDFADGTVNAAKWVDQNIFGPLADNLDTWKGARPMATQAIPAVPTATATPTVVQATSAQPTAGGNGSDYWDWCEAHTGSGGTTPPTPPQSPTPPQPPQQPPAATQHVHVPGGPAIAIAIATSGGGAMPPGGVPPITVGTAPSGAGCGATGGATPPGQQPPGGGAGPAAGGGGVQQPPAAGQPSGFHRVIVDLWGIGNFWFRIAMLIVAVWPLAAAIAAFGGQPAFTAAVALMPLFAGILVLLLWFDPLFLAALGTFGFGRRVLAALGIIIGAELAMGVYLSLVPFGKDPQLVLPALLVMITLAIFLMSGVKGRVISVLMMALMAIAAVVFLGGRDEVGRKLSTITLASAAPGGVQRYAVGELDEVEVRLPPRFWGNVCTDKPVFVRVDGGSFRLDPPCKVSRQEKDGSFISTGTMGDATSGVYHVKAAPGEKMAEVTVTSVKK